MNTVEDQTKKAALLAGSLLGVDSSQLSLEDITPSFSWAKRHKIYWALNQQDRRSVVVIFGPNDSPFVTTSQSGLSLLSLILVDELGTIPDGLGASELAAAVRRLTLSPQGLVGSPEMLKPAFPPLEAWIRSQGIPADQQTKLIRQNMASPVLQIDPKTKKWSLDFSYFNERGGIEGWHLEGNDREISSSKLRSIAADETLNWPFE